MSTVANILTNLGYRIDVTIGAATNPTQSACIGWINETLLWITGVLSEENSELGRTLGTITTVKKTITGISQANPGSVTCTAHGFSNNDLVLIKGATGMTEVNDTWFTVTSTGANTFTIGVDTSAYTAYSSGGYAYKKTYTTLATGLYALGQKGWIEKTNTRETLSLCEEEKCTEYDPTGVDEPEFYYLNGSNGVTFLNTPNAALMMKIPYWGIPTALTQTSDTVPYGGLFDNLIIEALLLRAQNKDEYNLDFDLKWFQFVTEKARRLIRLRQGTGTGISSIRG